MNTLSRRDLLKLGTTVSAVSGLASFLSIEKVAAASPKNRNAFSANHQVKQLAFNPAKLPGLSEKLMKSHWENNYGGAVKALNQVEAKLAALAKDKDIAPSIYGGHKREQQLRLGSVILHEKYFGNLGGDGKPAGDVKDAIASSFGDLNAWEGEFRKAGLGLSGGSGWVVLVFNLHQMRLENYWSWDHLHNLPGGYPLLVLDMYEHAYHMDYGAQTAKYLDAFMANVNWDEVNRRYLTVKKVVSQG